MFHSVLQEGQIWNTSMVHWIGKLGNDSLKARKELGNGWQERERCKWKLFKMTLKDQYFFTNFPKAHSELLNVMNWLWPMGFRWLEHYPIAKRVQVQFPGKEYCLGWGFHPWSRRKSQPVDASLLHGCFSLSLALALKAMKKMALGENN